MSQEDEDFYDDSDLEMSVCPRCMGDGMITCYCGGDLCVCTNYGDRLCPDCAGLSPWIGGSSMSSFAMQLGRSALLRWAYAEGANRSDIIDHHLSHVWLGRERLPMMHRDGWEGPKIGNSGAPFGWFVFERRPLLPGAFIVRRMSWRESA